MEIKPKRRSTLTEIKKEALKGNDVTKELGSLIRAYEQELLGLHENGLHDENRKKRYSKVSECWKLASSLGDGHKEAT